MSEERGGEGVDGDLGVYSCQVMEDGEGEGGAGEKIPLVGGEEEIFASNNLCCSPQRWLHRWLILAVMCFLNFGSYFCYDNPAALEDDFTKGLGLSQTEYGLLYTVYAWPNVVFPLIGGLLIDGFLGLRLAAFTFAGFIMVGQLVFGLGAQGKAFWLMLIGRILFAVGGENLAVCGNNYAVKWFNGKELNTVFGIQLSFSRVGSTVNMYSMEPLLEWIQGLLGPGSSGYFVLGTALLVGGISTVVSFLCSIVLAYFDARRDRWLAREKRSQVEVIAGETGETSSAESAQASFSLRDFCHLPISFWLLSAICVCFYNAIFPFIGFGLDFFKEKWGLSQVKADTANSLIYLMSIAASPILGFLVDVTGRNLLWVGLASLIGMAGMSLLTFTHLTPYVGVVLMGVAYSLLASSLWGMVAYIVPERLLGTAYGAMQSIQNLGVGVVFLVAGVILDKGGYLFLNIFYLAWLALSLLFAVLLLLHDRRSSEGMLAMSPLQRSDYQQRQLLH